MPDTLNDVRYWKLMIDQFWGINGPPPKEPYTYTGKKIPVKKVLKLNGISVPGLDGSRDS